MIADFHNDFLTAVPYAPIAPMAEQVECAVCALFRGRRDFSALRSLAENFLKNRPGNLFLGLEDVGYLATESVEAVSDWDPVYVSLTWNGENALAGGCRSFGRLSARGERVVKELTVRGIAIDCAHLNPESFCDVLDCGARVVDSHTCLAGIRRHPRNLFDWQVREIIAGKGLIGLTLVGDFLTEKTADAGSVFRQFDYAVQKFGADWFCFGTDFFGTEDLPAGIRSYRDLAQLKELFEKAGYPRQAMEGLLHENLQKFLFGAPRKA